MYKMKKGIKVIVVTIVVLVIAILYGIYGQGTYEQGITKFYSIEIGKYYDSPFTYLGFTKSDNYTTVMVEVLDDECLGRIPTQLNVEICNFPVSYTFKGEDLPITVMSEGWKYNITYYDNTRLELVAIW